MFARFPSHRILTCAIFVLITCAGTLLAEDETLARRRYPLAKAENIRPPTILLDDSEAGEDTSAKAWGNQARALCEEWFPLICRFLATDDWTPPETVRLVLKKDLKAPGATSGATIQLSLRWIADHPDDFGMVIHELTHVIQNYPPGPKQPGWLVEGIADYIRYWKYEPELPRRRVDGTRASYRDGYGTTGAFLAWIVARHDKRIVRRLDAALRAQAYSEELFREATGKSLDAAWAEFIASQ